jgi:hypothetical protein
MTALSPRFFVLPLIALAVIAALARAGEPCRGDAALSALTSDGRPADKACTGRAPGRVVMSGVPVVR